MSENVKKGGISVETEHMFPIIKKWLYSEKDIFLREIVSNACDAVTKLKRLDSLGKINLDKQDYKITVTLNKDEKTLTVSDNGIGMTEEEVSKYICQMALSGAVDFISRYEGENSDSKESNGIIGHFGLGFYSAFMVSDTVELLTKSYLDEPAVKWVCDEAGEYEISQTEKETRGTDVIMHITESESEYLSATKIKEILDKYCAFMPVEIYFVDECEEKHECDCKDHDHKHDEECECKDHEPKPINDTNPLWQKNASDVTEDEYKSFYHKVFGDFRDPLFQIHINADYPLNFKGILYFPKLNHEYENIEGQVKLYYNQVFVADNIKEVIPEYLLMLKGVLDCPELPLNVSRSYLQNSAYVSKMSAHIVKKVADKLNGMFTNERENYEKLWRDVKMFVEYGCLRDQKFFGRVKQSILFELTDGRFVTTDEYLEKAKDKHESTVYYATDLKSQAQYISMFKDEDIQVVLLDKIIDTSFIGVLEQDKNIKFVRVDADIAEAFRQNGEKYENKELVDLFKEVSGNDKLEVKFESLKNAKIPAILNVSEQSRRMEDMMKLYAMNNGSDFSVPSEMTLILNSESRLIKKLGEDTKSEKNKKIAHQTYMLALISQRQLTSDELQTFLGDSFGILEENI